MEEKILELKRELDLILSNYAVDQVAKESGGRRRASKGILTRLIYEKIIKFAINESKVNFKFFYKTSSLPFKIKKDLPYLKLPQDFKFKRKFDKSGKGNEVEYDGFLTFQNEIKMFLEFKSYTEVSMLKRVFVDAFIAKQFFPNAKYSLCMLESAMGSPRSLISHSAITLIDYLQRSLRVKIDIFFLMLGVRNSKRDIGLKKFLKLTDLHELKITVNSFITFFHSFNKS